MLRRDLEDVSIASRNSEFDRGVWCAIQEIGETNGLHNIAGAYTNVVGLVSEP